MAIEIQTVESGGGTAVLWERLEHGPSDGVEVVTLTGNDLSVRVCPTRGLGILDFNVCGTRIGWDSPVGGPIHPSLVNLESRNKLGWLDGFSELLVRCGLAHVGPPGVDDAAGPIAGDLTLHGRAANIPAHSVEVGCDDEGPFVRGIVDEATLFGPRLRLTSETRIQQDGSIRVHDQVTNLGAEPSEYQLLYHVNVGPPVLDGGAVVSIDNAAAISPRDPRAAEGIETWQTCLPPTPGYAEQAYFFEPTAGELGQTIASLVSSDGLAFHLEFDPTELPCLTLWKCTQPVEAGYVVGLEPGTSYPNHKSYEREQGRVPMLAPGETAEKTLVLRVAGGVTPTKHPVGAKVFAEPSPPMAVPVD